jgi:hypothetical protein
LTAVKNVERFFPYAQRITPANQKYSGMKINRAKPLKAKLGTEDPFYEVIEEAYRVFSYPKPKVLGVCERCCMDREIEEDFFGPPIAELPLHYVQDWFFAAATPGEMPKSTWAYLLPRILEILACGMDASCLGLEVSLRRFETGVRANWSDEEWNVLDHFQRLYLKRNFDAYGAHLDDILCMFGLGGWPLEDLMEQVTAINDAALARRLWNDWINGCAPGREDVWITPFWDDPADKIMLKFYTSPQIYKKMEALALGDETEPELAQMASEVAGVIEANADWVSRS